MRETLVYITIRLDNNRVVILSWTVYEFPETAARVAVDRILNTPFIITQGDKGNSLSLHLDGHSLYKRLGKEYPTA